VADLVQPIHDGRRWTDQRCISSSSTSRSLLGLIHATVPFAPPLSSFECAEQRRFLDDGVLIRISDTTLRLTKSSNPLAWQFQDWR
jgi:hypothetical protein